MIYNMDTANIKILWCGNLYPAVYLTLFIAEADPSALAFELQCDIIGSQPTEVLAGTVGRLNSASDNLHTEAGDCVTALRQFYFDWSAKHYGTEHTLN